LTSIERCGFEQVWKNKVIATYGTENVFFIDIDDLIKNK